MGVLRRGEGHKIQGAVPRWSLDIPEAEGIIKRREQVREICRELFDNGFASLSVKLLFREKMIDEIHEVRRKLKSPKTFEEEYAKVIILRKIGEGIQAKQIINSTSERKTIEEMELLGIELGKIDPRAADAVAQVHLEEYPKNIEVLIAAANIYRTLGSEEFLKMQETIREKLRRADYPRKIKNRAKLVVFQDKARLEGILENVKDGNLEKMRQYTSKLHQDEAGRVCRELEDCLRGHYFEIEEAQLAKEVLDAYMRLCEVAKTFEKTRIARIIEVLETGNEIHAAGAAAEFERIDWRFSERRTEITRRMAQVLMKNQGDRLTRSAVAKMAIDSNDKELFLEVIEIARRNGDESSVGERYDQAIKAKLLNSKDASNEARKIEETDIALATRIRSKFGEELAQEMLDSLIAKVGEIDTKTLKECMERVFQIDRIREDGMYSEKVRILVEEYEKRRDIKQMN